MRPSLAHNKNYRCEVSWVCNSASPITQKKIKKRWQWGVKLAPDRLEVTWLNHCDTGVISSCPNYIFSISISSTVGGDQTVHLPHSRVVPHSCGSSEMAIHPVQNSYLLLHTALRGFFSPMNSPFLLCFLASPLSSPPASPPPIRKV